MQARAAAIRNGSDLASELIVAGIVEEAHFAEVAAEVLGLPFEPVNEIDEIFGVETLLGRPPPRLIKTCDPTLQAKVFVCPTFECLDRIARSQALQSQWRGKIRVTTPSQVLAAIDRQTASARSRAATLSLSADTPRFSARTVIEPQQSAAIIAILLGAAVLHHFDPALLLTTLHVISTTFFALCLGFRFPAIFLPKERRSPARTIPEPGGGDATGTVPIYSVLVALHHEVAMIPKLVESLERLDWPKTRLDIKLVCEADDLPTIRAAYRETHGRAQFSVVLVPPGQPRTKPKALNHALPLAFGEFVVLYDAEDEPDPLQLREAYGRFRDGPPELACLQAPLVIRNGHDHWLAGLFALEYAALFRRLLPWLAHHEFPLPLGGTSNHFVRRHLVAVGGWDSHNVTEDADLGIRLYRAGYRIETLTRPTYEQAPERWLVWHRQRTRWMKGWFVTYLLHMREPLRLCRNLGAKAAVAFQLLFLGMLASSVAHPFFIAICLYYAWELSSGYLTLAEAGFVFALDVFNVVFGYALFIAHSSMALEDDERRALKGRYRYIPAYWAILAFSSLRAIIQLFIDPHKWEKTPHGLDSRADTSDPRYRIDPIP
ncbi:glycosyltransferase family 2 protein [Jiella marina]|uniref:glycosyltransferase family 2 protein n=1 Tax=Jiella sp. LLJ827 TaxID=2917712 RepID=UPI002101413E|nr:glycosyltransferase family 2 protein [Jiella sp. LLJ827]MCQ0989960.1 glycosyltransferase [Jiella sp. LLJ827]